MESQGADATLAYTLAYDHGIYHMTGS